MIFDEMGGMPDPPEPRKPTPGEMREAARRTARVIKRAEREALQAKKAAEKS